MQDSTLTPPHIDNLSASQTGAALAFTVSANACAADFCAVLAWLPHGFELGFYDQYYPSMSDPGAYVSVQRKDGAYIYKLGNHGWSSDWLKQSQELLAAWMLLNMTQQHPHSQPLDTLRVRKALADPWPHA